MQEKLEAFKSGRISGPTAIEPAADNGAAMEDEELDQQMRK